MSARPRFSPESYRGWSISYWRDSVRERDVWTARRFGGVQMNAHSEEAIKRMIDDRALRC